MRILGSVEAKIFLVPGPVVSFRGLVRRVSTTMPGSESKLKFLVLLVGDHSTSTGHWCCRAS